MDMSDSADVSQAFKSDGVGDDAGIAPEKVGGVHRIAVGDMVPTFFGLREVAEVKELVSYRQEWCCEKCGQAVRINACELQYMEGCLASALLDKMAVYEPECLQTTCPTCGHVVLMQTLDAVAG